MGQTITVEPKQMDQFCVFTTDRSLTGQDSSRFASRDEAESETSFPATLAVGLFDCDDAIDHVFVGGSDVIVRRNAMWDDSSVTAAVTTISRLFRFYE